MEKTFVSWSGGKDCCQAGYQARLRGYDICYLLNMVTHDGRHSCSHGIATDWIRLQSAAMGIPLIQKPTTGENYETVFVQTLIELKAQGVSTGIFGDIDFDPHREWIERICRKAGVNPVLPLWQEDQRRIAADFVNLGFESIVIAVQADLLGPEWLSRKFDTRFLKDIDTSGKNITPCGEAGEFHTLVIDGPLFKKRLEIQESEKVQRGNHWFLDIRKCELILKEGGR